MGFTQALLMSGARSVCLLLCKVNDTATALSMQRFYANMLGRGPRQTGAMPKANSLRKARAWPCGLHRPEAMAVTAKLSGGIKRGTSAKARQPTKVAAAIPNGGDDNDRPPRFWAAFVLAGDPD